MFICLVLKFRSQARHVLISPIPSSLSLPSCLWLLALLVTEFTGYVCGVLWLSLEKKQERLGLGLFAADMNINTPFLLDQL